MKMFVSRFFMLTCLFYTWALVAGAKPVFSSVLITELHPNPASGEPEWIELHNPDAEAIDLTNWELWDELSSPSLLLTLHITLNPGETKVFTFENPKLNNAADGVTLRTPAIDITDSFSYSASEQAKSWARTVNTWQISEPSPGTYLSMLSEPTPQPTSSPSASPILLPTPSPTASPAKISISELFPCPATDTDEYVTITNTGTTILDLSTIRITDEQQNQRQTTGSLPPLAESSIKWTADMLNNTGDTVFVLSSSGVVLASAKYTSCTIGEPLLLIEGEWQTETTILAASPTVPSPSPSLSTHTIEASPTATPGTLLSPAKKKKPPLALPILFKQYTESTTSAHTEPMRTLEYRQRNIPQGAVLGAILGSGFLLMGGATVLYTQPPKYPT